MTAKLTICAVQLHEKSEVSSALNPGVYGSDPSSNPSSILLYAVKTVVAGWISGMNAMMMAVAPSIGRG